MELRPELAEVKRCNVVAGEFKPLPFESYRRYKEFARKHKTSRVKFTVIGNPLILTEDG
jgi:hypothetical protein